ncbi:MAG: twin-arginine translocation signal domain-containing protein [Gemmatimonadaceae bacterium]|nr:twin-arginine translocation signal domain-containing protein [Gemmatimonadaceae bacterium]
MTTSRRDFLKTSAAAAAITGSRGLFGVNDPLARISTRPGTDAFVEELAMEGLNAARAAGASYADVRVGRYRRQSVNTRERQVTGVSDSESFGIGIRTLVNGSWGFAATSTLTRDAVQSVAREAAKLSRAANAVQKRPVELAPVAAVKGTWRTPVTRDPLEVPIEEKVALLLAANEAALKVPRVRFVNSGLQLLREEKTLATTDGTLVTQTFIRVGPGFTATAIADGDFQSYNEELAPRGQGWEYIESLNMPGNAEKWASLAAEKLSAKSVEVGRYDLILDPTNLWLTIHESIGHPTELDRAMGYEANYAGTSFIAPPEKHIGKLRYGRDIMNIQADRTQEGSLSRTAWDDEGVPADKWLIVEKGLFKDYQTTREQAAWIAPLTGVRKSHGCSFADSWSSVQFQRMPNISLLPGEKDYMLDDIIAATDRGIVIKNRGSWSIDHQRYNFQFSGQVYYEVKNGKITGMLKDVAYQSRTPEFWNSMDMIGGKRSYWLGGSFGDGKGEPAQSNSVSHGCVPARFRDVNIVNTGRSA